MSIYVPPRPVSVAAAEKKAGPIGPGAGVLQTEFPLAMLAGFGRGTPQERMRRWIGIAEEAGWPSAAENAIATAILRQPWAVEDADEVEIDDTSPDTLARSAFDIIDRPMAMLGPDEGAKYTRSELWRMTLRHAGICGSSFWYLNSQNTYGQPQSIKYIAPWRMFPNEDKQGNLISWQLDKTPNNPGITISLEEVIHFFIYPPDVGHFGRSQMEIALQKSKNDASFDRHVASVLKASGRLSGILSPKTGDSLNPDQLQQLVNDARTLVEQPDNAARLQVTAGPVDFLSTSSNFTDLQIADLLKLYRDDTLALWGVPPGYIVAQASGLNSGEARKYDKQVLWENAVHARVEMLTEAIQLHLIDRWDALGLNLTFDIEEPVFDDDSGRFDLVQKSLNTPMRNVERRALVNLEPFGQDVTNPTTGMLLDDEVWLPSTQVLAFVSPEDGPGFVPPPPAPPVQIGAAAEPNAPAALAAGEQSAAPKQLTAGPVAAKATIRPNVEQLHQSLTSLRADLDKQYTPRVKDEVNKVLEEQKRELTQRTIARLDHLLANRGKDLAGLWDDAKWDRRMKEALQPSLIRMTETVDSHIRATLNRGKAGPVAAVNYALLMAATRITDINDRSRDAFMEVVRVTIAEAISEGWTNTQAADALRTAIAAAELQNATPVFDEYRAEMIARTEMMTAYNDATLGSYHDMGVTEVQAIDGDEWDEKCRNRDGRTYSLEQANAETEHPNGTLDWVPVIPEMEPVQKAKPIVTRIEYDEFGRLAAVYEQ